MFKNILKFFHNQKEQATPMATPALSLTSVTPPLPFRTKEEYLVWVAQWKQEYKKLSEELRALRIELSKPHNVTIHKTNGWVFYISEQSGQQSTQAYRRADARKMLQIRKEMKEQSWKMKMARQQEQS